MKTYAYIAATLSALLAPTSVVGHESMLTSDEQETSNIRRSLIDPDKYKAKYLSIFCRCCGNGDGGTAPKFDPAWKAEGFSQCTGEEVSKNGKDYCTCPVRASTWKSWWSSESYMEKWNAKCAPGGSIRQKAGIE